MILIGFSFAAFDAGIIETKTERMIVPNKIIKISFPGITIGIVSR